VVEADEESFGEEGFDHVVDVGLEVGFALAAELERHVEYHIAGALVAQFELVSGALAKGGSTFLNMSSVRLLLLK
jgi:hypothetical protein